MATLHVAPRERRGIALPLVLWAVVIGAALLTVVVFLILQEQRAGRAGRRLVHAFTRAESALAEELTAWTPASLNRALPGPRDSLGPGPTPGDGVSTAIWRFNQGLFLMTVGVRDGPTRARLGRLVRVRPVHLPVGAALTSGGDVWLGGDATVSGEDWTPPASTECPAPDSGVAGIVAPQVFTTGSPSISGSPPTVLGPRADSGLDPVALQVFDSLASQATVYLPGGVLETGPATVGTVCSVQASGNWGDPDRLGPCAAYMPIVHVAGDLELLAGRGQGVVLVEGDLKLHGPYRFAGLLMLRGRVDVVPGDTGVRLSGAVFAGGVAAASTPPAVLSITYSKCLISNALQSTGSLVPLRSRSWKALF